MNDILWQSDKNQKLSCNMGLFLSRINKKYSQVRTYDELYLWSINHSDEFWQLLCEFFEIQFSHSATSTFQPGEKIYQGSWFPDSQLNFAQHLLAPAETNPDIPAIVFRNELNQSQEISYGDLYHKVACLVQVFHQWDLKPGDVVVGYLPNIPETVIAALACASTGVIWSSCSPDFGVAAVVDRFSQISPKAFIFADGYFYKGKEYSCEEKSQAILQDLPSVERIVKVSYVNQEENQNSDERIYQFHDLIRLNSPADAEKIAFTQLPFNHPLYIMYSSGTTGKPKCIVHGAGGTLIQHLKELSLHSDLRKNDKIFYYTTCGWMMWNWLISSLAVGATIVLYDGNPMYPQPDVLLRLVDEENVTHFGTSAKYLSALHKADVNSLNSLSLNSLRVILSTGSPLTPELFDYVYQSIKSSCQLSSISGGTDIISCFALGNPLLPVRRGELQCRGLGMAVKVYDDKGKSVINEKGELVCTNAFPSMPLGFWNDDGNSRYEKSYYSRFENVWAHGDYASISNNGGVIIYGRSDAILNPGGVRIGTAEIYRQLENLPFVLESVVIGQQWKNDVRVILFVKLQEGHRLDEQMITTIKQQILVHTTPRHVPDKVIAIKDIPCTISGKIAELSVSDVVHHRAVKNKEALANPGSLDYYENIPELTED